MAKKSDGPPPSGPTTAAGTEAEPSPATLAFGTTTQAGGQAELRPHQAEAVAAVQAAAAPAADPKKKKGTRNIELRLMGYIDRRLRAMPVKARKRVVDWMKEYDIEDEG